ncbi:hypothetical protein AB3X52_09565 [Nocardioides sp. DS6]|uniref:Gram-positive cocci surface proteins LPxTG domain-containing protein n=1 Tax=Nocardioides eburneus TaxID=3231482 RepID=A0ABV3SY47_9ACTN
MIALTLALVGVLVPMQVDIAQAANTQDFTSKFSTNANGAIITVGNNLLTCQASSSCTSAKNGAAVDDNSFTMVNLDADDDASTFNSSSSTLSLPAGATVLWAGLYWGARLDRGTGGSAGTGSYNQMQFRTPGGDYQTITASTATHDQFGPNTSSSNAYQRYADVTSLVSAAGNGAYWGANVVAGTGADRYAGWAMTVVYSAPGLPLRNLTVFDGFNAVGAGAPQNITVNGFTAPPYGTVDAQLTMVAYEGDLAQTGDYTRLNNTQLATGISPGSNFFDSTNDVNGSSVSSRTPADRNMLGFDIKNLGASGAIPNDATSATFTFSSNGDVYYPGVVGLAINLYAPDYTASSKTVVDLNGNNPARPGDTLQYTLNYVNTGQDPAVGVVSRDPLPANTTYVPDSLALVDPATGTTTSLTDDAGDDRGEVSDDTVTVRLGSGANATTGGRMACSGTGCTDDGTSRQTYTFKVTLDAEAGGTTVTNLANLDYATETTGTSATYTTNPASVDVTRRADLSITKDINPDPASVGGDIRSVITVTNKGPNDAQDVVMKDPVVAGSTIDNVEPPDGGSCQVADGVITCTMGDLPNGESRQIVIHGHIPSSSTQTTFTNVASVSTSSYDPDQTNNVATDTATLRRTSDMKITKSVTPASAAPGAQVTYTLEVSNNGPSDTSNVVLTDQVANAAQLTLGSVTGTTGGATCDTAQSGSLRCTVASLAAGATASVTLTGTLSSSLGAGVNVDNTATVTSGNADPDATNNSATARVTTTAPSADVQLTKKAPATVYGGGPITYTIQAQNTGPSDATNVVVTDTVPDTVTNFTATTDRGSCVVNGQQVTCTIATLTAGAAAQIQIAGTVVASAPASGTIANTATVTSGSTDPNTSNDAATATSNLSAHYDLSVEKTANRASLPGAAPRAIDYTITVRNAGPSTARGVTLSDLVPTGRGIVFDSYDGDATCDTSKVADTSAGDADHGLLTCSLDGPVAPGGTAVVHVHLTATETLEGTGDVTETVTVAGADDTDSGNNQATWTLSGDPYSDLSLSKTAPRTVRAGTQMDYTFVVTNTPPDPDEEQLVALAPTIADTLPAGVSFVSARVVDADGNTIGEPVCTTSGQDVSCVLPNDIQPNATETMVMTVAVAADAADGSNLLNTAEVIPQASNPDPTTQNNRSTATTTVQAVDDLQVHDMSVTMRTGDPAYDGPGSWRTATFTITNDGPSLARSVTFRMDVSADVGVRLVGDLADRCTLVNQELVCTIDGTDLAPGQSVTESVDLVVVSYEDPGDYTASVTASTTTPETTLANNTAQAPFTVGEARTDLQITKDSVDRVVNPADGHDAEVAGTTYGYTITLSTPDTAPDRYDADAQDVVLDDPMPAGFTATLVSTTQGTCSVADDGASVHCDIGTVAGYYPAQAPDVTVTVYGIIDPGTEGEQIPNTATATSTTPAMDGTPTKVSATKRLDIIEQADLQVVKTPDAQTSYAGGSAGFTLTAINAGPSDVEDAILTDTLPAGMTLDPANSPGCAVTGTTDDGREIVTCDDADHGGGGYLVEAGASVNVRVVAKTSSDDTAREVTNTAHVASPTAEDPDTGNNTTTVTTHLDVLADVAISAAVSTATPAAGQDITYTGYTINNGPSAAQHVTGDVTFPPGFVPVSYDVPNNDCTWSPEAPADPDSVAWSDTSYTLHCEPQDPSTPFEPGIAATSVVVMHIPGDTPAGTYTGPSKIATDTPESTYANNTAEAPVYVQHVSDTSITKTLVEPNPMVAGQPATWRLTVHNNGPSDANNVVIADQVPAKMSFVSATDESGSACPAPEIHDTETIVKCPMGTLKAGASTSATVTFQIAADAGDDELCNSALVGSGSLDPIAVDDPDDDVYSDNEDEACGTVKVPPTPPATDVGVRVTTPQKVHHPGDTARFTAVVRNRGPEQATDVVVRFPVPSGLTKVSGLVLRSSDGTSPEAHCTIVMGRTALVGRPAQPARSLVCTVGDLAPGQQVTYRITGTVWGSAGRRIALSGVVSHGERDTDPANDRSAAAVRLVARHAGGGNGGTTGGGNGHGGTPTSPATSATSGTSGGSAGGSSGGLPDTGGPERGYLVGGVAAVLVGLVLLVVGRRRRTR